MALSRNLRARGFEGPVLMVKQPPPTGSFTFHPTLETRSAMD